jgi:hypothetical protein
VIGFARLFLEKPNAEQSNPAPPALWNSRTLVFRISGSRLILQLHGRLFREKRKGPGLKPFIFSTFSAA